DKDGTEKLVWSCRLEEPMKYGELLRMVPKHKETVADDGKDVVDEMEKSKKEIINEYPEE
ncbi:MAG: hypothetical protein DRQ13_08490, partial [Ignavibacteriae bacterium]